MWNKYIKSNEYGRKRLLAEYLTGLSIGCNVKTNEKHLGTGFSGIVGDINLETGVVNVEIHIGHGQMREIHMDYLDIIN